MDYSEINRLARRFRPDADLVDAARRQASIGPSRHSDVLQRTQELLERPQRLADITAGRATNRHLRLVDQASRSISGSVARIPSAVNRFEASLIWLATRPTG